MKILIFEYITGGGFCNEDLPFSLAHEGGLMLNALLDDFAVLSEHEVIVMLDERCLGQFATENFNVISVKETNNVLTVFEKVLNECDAVWIIAPETDDILLQFTQEVEKANKILLSNPSSAISETADKLQTFNSLTTNKILTIPTRRLIDLSGFQNLTGLGQFPFVIKPRNGVGCENSFVVQDQTEFQEIINEINLSENYIIQPFIKGDALSISALFKQGQAQLISINRQHLQIKKQQFQLNACEVNIPVENKNEFQQLLNKIAQAFPDLFGYVGIDLIVSDSIDVVEINPRLTSSYSGIKKALGINIAEAVLKLSHQEMSEIKPEFNQTVFIEIAKE